MELDKILKEERWIPGWKCIMSEFKASEIWNESLKRLEGLSRKDLTETVTMMKWLYRRLEEKLDNGLSTNTSKEKE